MTARHRATEKKPRRRAAIYLRISDDPEGREEGVERQEELCRTVAKRLRADVVKIYKDNDISASTNSTKPRPDYDQMLADARRHLFDIIIAYKSARLTRRPREHIGQVELAREFGTEFHYYASPSFDLNTAAGREVALIMAARDAAEPEHLSEQALAQRRQARLKGKVTGGPRAFGYERGLMKVREDEADMIRAAVKLVLAGGVWSIQSITKDWTKKCPPTTWTKRRVRLLLLEADPATLTPEYRRLAKEVRRRVEDDESLIEIAASFVDRRIVVPGAEWNRGTVREILMNPRYAKILYVDGRKIKARWPRIISEDDHYAVCAILGDAKRTTNGGRNSLRWLGGGIYQCGVDGCNSDMRPSGASAWGPGVSAIYRCRVSSHAAISAPAVDAVVHQAVVGILRANAARLAAAARPDAEQRLSALRAKRDALRARLSANADRYATMEIDEDEYLRIRDAVTPQIVEAEQALDALLDRSAVGELAGASDPGAAYLALGTQGRLNQQRAIMRELLTVTILPGGKGRKLPTEQRVVMTPRHPIEVNPAA